MSHIYALLDTVLNDRPGYVTASENALTFIDSPLPAPGKIDALTLFVPGTDVSLHRASLPARSNAEASRAAAYAVEDDLAQSVDMVHAALGPRDAASNLRDIHICDREKMQEWVTALAAKGYDTARLVAETSVLPNTPTAISIETRVLFSLPGQKLAVDASFPNTALQAFANLARTPLEIVGADLAHRLEADKVAATSDQHPLIVLAENAEASSSIVDLRQGAFSSRQAFKLDLQDWKLPIGLAAAAAIAWLAIAGIETWSLKRSANYMDAESVRLYQSYYPNEPVPTRLVTAINEKIGGPVAGSLSFLKISAILYDAIDSVEGATITSMRYDSDIGRINVGMSYNNYGDDVLMKTALEAKQLGVTLGSSRSSGRSVSGELTVEVKP